MHVDGGSDGEGHWGIWAGAVSSKRLKSKLGTDRPTKRGVESRSNDKAELLCGSVKNDDMPILVITEFYCSLQR